MSKSHVNNNNYNRYTYTNGTYINIKLEISDQKTRNYIYENYNLYSYSILKLKHANKL